MMDCTHDNEAPNDKRTPQDAMATGALVSFSYAAVGSTKGFDDFYGKLLDVVQESRHYEIYEDPEHPHSLGKVKRVLNHLHIEMALAGFSEGHWHQEGDVGYVILFNFRRTNPQNAYRSISSPTGDTLRLTRVTW